MQLHQPEMEELLVVLPITVDNRTVPTITTNDADNIICDSFAINFTAGGTVGTDTIAWLVNDNPVGVATQVWSPPAGTINDGDSVKVRITTAGPGGCVYESSNCGDRST